MPFYLIEKILQRTFSLVLVRSRIFLRFDIGFFFKIRFLLLNMLSRKLKIWSAVKYELF